MQAAEAKAVPLVAVAKAEVPVVAADRTQAAALVEAHQVDQRELQRAAVAAWPQPAAWLARAAWL